MKSAGLAVISAAIALSGIYISDRKRRQSQLLFLIAEFFSETARLCSGGSASVAQVFFQLGKKAEFRSLSFISKVTEGISEGANIKILWETAVEKSQLSLLDLSEKRLLVQFSDSLEAQTKEEFLRDCTALSREFSHRGARLQKSWEKTGESVALTGVLIAAAVFFIFM